MKVILMFGAMLFSSAAFASYSCQLEHFVEGRWTNGILFSFATDGGGEVFVEPVDSAGAYKLRAQNVTNAVATLEVINIKSGMTVGGTLVPSGKPLNLTFSDFKVSCLPK